MDDTEQLFALERELRDNYFRRRMFSWAMIELIEIMKVNLAYYLCPEYKRSFVLTPRIFQKYPKIETALTPHAGHIILLEPENVRITFLDTEEDRLLLLNDWYLPLPTPKNAYRMFTSWLKSIHEEDDLIRQRYGDKDAEYMLESHSKVKTYLFSPSLSILKKVTAKQEIISEAVIEGKESYKAWSDYFYYRASSVLPHLQKYFLRANETYLQMPRLRDGNTYFLGKKVKLPRTNEVDVSLDDFLDIIEPYEEYLVYIEQKMDTLDTILFEEMKIVDAAIDALEHDDQDKPIKQARRKNGTGRGRRPDYTETEVRAILTDRRQFESEGRGKLASFYSHYADKTGMPEPEVQRFYEAAKKRSTRKKSSGTK